MAGVSVGAACAGRFTRRPGRGGRGVRQPCLCQPGAELRVIDVSDPTSPIEVGAFTAPDRIYGFAAAEGRVYLAYGLRGLLILDTSDPSRPTLLGTYETPGQAVSVAPGDDVALGVNLMTGLGEVFARRRDDVLDLLPSEGVGLWLRLVAALQIIPHLQRGVRRQQLVLDGLRQHGAQRPDDAPHRGDLERFFADGRDEVAAMAAQNQQTLRQWVIEVLEKAVSAGRKD